MFETKVRTLGLLCVSVALASAAGASLTLPTFRQNDVCHLALAADSLAYETLSFSGLSNQTTLVKETLGPITITPDVGINKNNNKPTYYSSGSAARFYAGNTLTFTWEKAAYSLERISFSIDSKNSGFSISDCTVASGDQEKTESATNPVEISENTGKLVWTAGAKLSSGNIRIKSITVYYSDLSLKYLTSFSASAANESYFASNKINSDDFEVNGAFADGSVFDETCFTAEIGSDASGSYVKREDIVWGETEYALGDDTVRFTSSYPDADGNPLIVDVKINVNEPSINEIVINGDLADKSYAEGDSWDFSGLIATGMPAGIDLTDKVKWVAEPSAPSLGLEYLDVHAEYDGMVSETIRIEGLMVSPAYTVVSLTNSSFGKASSDGDLRQWSDDFTNVDWHKNSGNAFQTTSEEIRFYQGHSMSFTASDEHSKLVSVRLEFDSDYSDNSTNRNSLSYGESDYSDDYSANKTITVYPDQSGEIYIRAGKQVRLNQIYVTYGMDEDWTAAFLWAKTFLKNDASGFQCDPNGIATPSADQWLERGLEFIELSESSQSFLRDASANQNGSVFEQAAAKYDYILGKYNPTNDDSSDFDNWMDREIQPVAAYAGTMPEELTNPAVVACSALGLLAIAGGLGFAFYKKHRKVC